MQNVLNQSLFAQRGRRKKTLCAGEALVWAVEFPAPPARGMGSSPSTGHGGSALEEGVGVMDI